jgi:subtilisin family serine protease
VSTGSRSIVIGETDTGVEYTHPDLAANIWNNPGGIGGCASGSHGYNVLTHTCEPMDNDTVYNGHGTHVAGILGAVGNNGVGVAGMNWQTSILPVKWLDEKASGSTSALIEALQWLVSAKQAGVNIRVVNDSATFVGTAFSQALQEEIETLGANNILFVTASGNTGSNNDELSVRRYPCGYDRSNEICVAASNNNDELPSWAGYGAHTVDLAAPGVSIYSTLRNGTYGYLSGGSMASPQVAGAAALILSASPSLSATALKADILENVDKLSSLSGKLITGGRLDVCKALPGCVYTPPPPPTSFGKTTVGASSDVFSANRKRVNRYALSTTASLTKLSIYLAPTTTSGQQVLKGVVYADSGGAPGALLGTTEQLTFTSAGAAGWYDMSFASALKLTAGNYWIGVIAGTSARVAGFRYDSVSSSRDYNTNSYASGPSNPFGSVTTDSEQMSLYATYAPQAVPTNTAPPTITGTAQQGQTLTEVHGSWTNGPTGYAYRWLQCDGSGNNCQPIEKATAQTYVPVQADVGHTLKVQETASNEGGSSPAATSSATVVVVPQRPTNTSSPTIIGTAQQGQTLTEVHGSWTNGPTGYAYQWLQCDSLGNNCLPIEKATAQTYVPVQADIGHTLKVQEIASNEGGESSPATSSATSAVGPPAPGNISPPTITGTAQQGQTLTEAHGSWTGEPTSYTYQWLQCDGSGNNCQPIEKATAQTYVPVQADVGHALRVQETASNEWGSGAPARSSATAAVVPPPPSNSAPPTITGTPQQGQTLTAHNGSWTNSPTSFSHQWLQCDALGEGCLPIFGATGQTYVLSPGDVGHTIRVEETASNAGGSGGAAISNATAPVLARVVPPAPTNISPPTISGTSQQGQTLTEVHGAWTGEPTSYAYQWLQCDSLGNNCQPIEKATAQTYVPVQADVGHTLRARETASNEGGESSPATSSATSAVRPPAPSNISPPTVTGAAQQGQTLTEVHGSWTNNPTGYAYQWLQCDSLGNGCLPIEKATAQTYVPVQADVGHTLKVRETASNEGGEGSPATSSATSGVVPPAPSNNSPPTITGAAQQGQTLSAQNGSWTNEPASFAYKWQRCDTSGAHCSTISEAAAQTYVVGSADVGSTLRVTVTASNAGGSSTPATSAQTAVVLAASATFGKTTVGASSDYFVAERKRVNRYAIPESGSVTKLSIYLAPTSTSGQQVLRGVIYADSSGTPAALLASTEQFTFSSTSAAGWYGLVFSSPIKLTAGNYWIGVMSGATAGVAGFRYDSVSGARDYNANTYASGATNPFGSFSSDSEQMSLYATYTPG